jgi:hypothetical protein
MRFAWISERVPGLVVSAQKVDMLRVLDFQAEEQHDSLQRVVASVHEVPDEHELSIRRTAG